MKTALILAILYLSVLNSANSQQDIIPFESDRWDKEQARQAEFLGKQCLMGIATLKDMEFTNGVIEFDLAVTGERSYPGVTFRAQSQYDYERIYIRPHLSKTFQNVVQYEGTFNGIDSWQLYYGPGKTSSAIIPVNQWFHVKIEVKDTRARVFINNPENPVLTITELAHGLSKGAVGIWGPTDGSAYFSNFSCRIDNSLQFPEPILPDNPTGIITNWEISQPDKLAAVDIENTPETQGIENLQWKKVQSLPSGLVDISRYYGRTGQTPDIIWAKTELFSEKEQTKQLAFGYSDYISIFLNGKLLFMGNSQYTSRDGNFQGIVGLNDFIFLPLIKGKNELIIAIIEVFGGWGFIFQDVEAVYVHPDLTRQWEIKNKFKYPESVVYDNKRDVLYVSNFTYENSGFISRVKLNGEIENPEWISGIVQPTGMCIHNDKLFVVGRFNIIEIDLETNTISNRYPIPSPVFANDITCDEKGTMYITDGGKGAIYKFEDNKISEWIKSDELMQVNGITIDKNKLFAGTSRDGKIKSIDMVTKEIKTLFNLGAGTIMDGVTKDGQGNLLVSDNAGRLFRVSPDGNSELLLNTKSRQLFIADFEYIHEKQLLIIPTMTDNKLIAYKIK